MPLPRAIYFETSSLWPVAHRRDDPALQTLQKYSEDLRIPLLTTRLATDELAQKYAEECLRSHKVLQSAIDDFARRGVAAPKVAWPVPFVDVLEAMPGTVRANLQSYGLTILPNHTVDQDRLLSMAIRKELPFTERGEKGFRDAVLLFTVFEHARASNWRDIMIITNDGPIIEACSSLPETEGIEIQIARDITAATGTVDDYIDSLMREREETRKKACRDLALANRERIEDFIRQRGTFSETLFFGQLVPGEQVERVVGVSLRDLQTEAVGELPEETAEGEVRASFNAETEVEARVSGSAWPAVRRFKVGAEADVDPIRLAIQRRVARRETRKVRLKARLEGTVHVREKDGREEFLRLELDAFYAPGEFVTTLFEALLQSGEEPPEPPSLPE